MAYLHFSIYAAKTGTRGADPMMNKEWQKDVNIKSKKYNCTLNKIMNQFVIKSTKQSNKIGSFFLFRRKYNWNGCEVLERFGS